VSVREADIFRLWIQHYAPHVDRLAALIVAERADQTGELESLCAASNVEFQVWKPEWFRLGASVRALQRTVKCLPADWIIHADSDEFLYEIDDIRSLVSQMEKENADHAVAWMADRLAFGGRLGTVTGLKNVAELETAFPVRAAITEGAARGCAYKVCISRWPFLAEVHAPGPNLHRKAQRRLTLEHFKWRVGLEERLRKRIKDHAASKLPWGRESERILNELRVHGRIRAERWLAPRCRRIPGWMDFEDIYLEAVRRAPEKGHLAEVGVWQGRSLCFLAEAALAAGKRLRIDGVDSFRRFAEEKTGYPQELRPLVTRHSWLHLVAANLQRQGMLDFVNLIQVPSPQAARLYPRRSLDFVWLDGNHTYDAVLADLKAWWPRVRPGGLLGGHDYDQPQVRAALAAACLRTSGIQYSKRSFLATKPGVH
jgi:hypothetical protein